MEHHLSEHKHTAQVINILLKDKMNKIKRNKIKLMQEFIYRNVLIEEIGIYVIFFNMQLEIFFSVLKARDVNRF